MLCSSLHPVVCRKAHVFVYVICVCLYSGVQHVFTWVFYFVFLHLVYPMLPVSLGCSFLIAPSVFSNFCLEQDTKYHPLWINIYIVNCMLSGCMQC